MQNESIHVQDSCILDVSRWITTDQTAYSAPQTEAKSYINVKLTLALTSSAALVTGYLATYYWWFKRSRFVVKTEKWQTSDDFI